LFKKLFPNKLKRRLVYVFTFILFIALVFFLLRGPYLSNSIKRIVLPVLENATGERVIIDRAVINLFPFYFQAKGLKIFDKEGNRLLRITKMRAYIDLIGLFSKEIRVRRLTIKEPELTTDRKTLEKIINSIEKYSKRDNDKYFGFSLKSIKMTEGKFTLTDMEKQIVASGQGLYVEMVTKDTAKIGLSLKEGTLKLPDLPQLNAGIDGMIKIDGRRIKILGAKIYSSESLNF